MAVWPCRLVANSNASAHVEIRWKGNVVIGTVEPRKNTESLFASLHPHGLITHIILAEGPDAAFISRLARYIIALRIVSAGNINEERRTYRINNGNESQARIIDTAVSSLRGDTMHRRKSPIVTPASRA